MTSRTARVPLLKKRWEQEKEKAGRKESIHPNIFCRTNEEMAKKTATETMRDLLPINVKHTRHNEAL